MSNKLSPAVQKEIERIIVAIDQGGWRPALERLAQLAATEAAREAVRICYIEGSCPSTLWEEPFCWTHASDNCAAAIAQHFGIEKEQDK